MDLIDTFCFFCIRQLPQIRHALRMSTIQIPESGGCYPFLFFLASHFSWPLATQSFQPVLWSQGIPFLALSVIVVLENFLAQLFSHSEPPWLMLHRIVICVGIISFARVSSRSCSWLVTLLPSAISYLVTTNDHLVSRPRDSAAFSVYSLHILQKPYLSSDFLQMIR